MRRSGSSQPLHPPKCSLFSHNFKRGLKQGFCLFRTLISIWVERSSNISYMCSSVHTVCVRCSNMAPVGCFKSSSAISAQAVYYSTQRTNKSPRFIPLQQPIPFGQFALFIFCFVLVRAHLYRFGRETLLKPNKSRWIIVDLSSRLFTDPVCQVSRSQFVCIAFCNI